MPKVLVINPHPKNPDSRTLKVLNKFMDAYQANNQQDEINEEKLYEQHFPELGPDLFKAWGTLSNGGKFEDLTAHEQEKLAAYNKALNQYLAVLQLKNQYRGYGPFP